MAGTPPPSLEDRVAAVEKQLAPVVAKASPKLTTKQAGYLTTAALVISYILSSPLELPSWAHLGLTAAATGITAYETAELT